MPYYYAGITTRDWQTRIAEHRREGRKNIRGMQVGYVNNGRDANAWEREQGKLGYETGSGGVHNSYQGTVTCYTFIFDW